MLAPPTSVAHQRNPYPRTLGREVSSKDRAKLRDYVGIIAQKAATHQKIGFSTM